MTTGQHRALLVFWGGGTGAALRYLISLWAPPAWAAGVPLAILLINLAGAAGLGIVFVLADEAGLLRAATRLTVAVGFLGGFTTWSTFMTGAVTLLHEGQLVIALLYLSLSLLGGPLAVTVGVAATRRVLAAGSRRLTHEDLAAEIGSIEAEDREATGRAAGQQRDRR